MRLLRSLWCWRIPPEQREEIICEELIQGSAVCQDSLSSPQEHSEMAVARVPTMTGGNQQPHTDRSSNSRNGQGNAGSTESHLMNLPVELIQHIAAFADPPAVAALTLASRLLCAVIGRNFFCSLREIYCCSATAPGAKSCIGGSSRESRSRRILSTSMIAILTLISQAQEITFITVMSGL